MIDKSKIIEVLQGEIDKHQEWAKGQMDRWAKHGWYMFINGMVEALDIIKEFEEEPSE